MYYFFILTACIYYQLCNLTTNLIASPLEGCGNLCKGKLPDESEYNWENYKKKYNKTYTPEEDAERHKIFNEKVQEIKKHNKLYSEGKTTYIQSVNWFTDKKPEELTHLTGLCTKKGLDIQNNNEYE